MELTYATILINHCIGETLRRIGDEDPEKLIAYRTQLPQALHDVAMALFPGDDADCCEIDLDTDAGLFHTAQALVAQLALLGLDHVDWDQVGDPDVLDALVQSRNGSRGRNN